MWCKIYTKTICLENWITINDQESSRMIQLDICCVDFKVLLRTQKGENLKSNDSNQFKCSVT